MDRPANLDEAFPLEPIAERACRIANVTIADGRDVAFLLAAKVDGDYLTGLHLRRRGPPLTSGAIKALGLNARTIIGREFYLLLNETGLANPIEAANTLAIVFETTLHTFRDLAAFLRNFGPGTMLTVMRSNMASGPCAAIAAAPGTARLQEASLFPLADCSHPMNCACRYKGALTFE